MKNNYFILLLLLFGVSCKTSKEVTITFNSSKSDGFLGRTLSFIPPVNAADAQFALLAQKLKVDTFLIFGKQHNPEQYYYNEFKSENIDSLFFKKAKDVFDIDTSRLSHEKFDAETIFFMGKANTYFAIARKNKSYDFTLNHDVSNLYKTGETIFLNGMTARVSDLSFDGSSVKMHIQKSSSDKNFIGNPALTDFAGGNSFLLNNLFANKDLLVIDFWGSWCIPCISSIPDFKKLNETFSANRIGFLGILYDDLQNIKEVESLIDKNEIKWRQAFINRMDSNTLIDEWRIFAFPTYLVINKQHKIVFRGIGSTGFIKLKEFLEISIRE